MFPNKYDVPTPPLEPTPSFKPGPFFTNNQRIIKLTPSGEYINLENVIHIKTDSVTDENHNVVGLKIELTTTSPTHSVITLEGTAAENLISHLDLITGASPLAG